MASISSRCATCLQRRVVDQHRAFTTSVKVAQKPQRPGRSNNRSGGRPSNNELDSLLGQLLNSPPNSTPAMVVPGSRMWDPPAEATEPPGPQRRSGGGGSERRSRDTSSTKAKSYSDRPPPRAHGGSQSHGRGFGLSPRKSAPTHKPWETPPPAAAAAYEQRGSRTRNTGDTVRLQDVKPNSASQDPLTAIVTDDPEDKPAN